MTEQTAPQLDNQPGPGDNLPPGELQAFEENLKEQNRGIAERIRDLQVGLARVPETVTAETEAVVTDFIAQCKKALRDADERRKAHNKPLNDRKDRVQAFFRGLAQPAQKMIDDVTARLDVYRVTKERAERERLEAERQKQEAEEAIQRAAAEQLQREAEEKSRAARTDTERRSAAGTFQRAQEAEEQAAAAASAREAAERAAKGPVHVKGDTGATGYATTRLTFNVFDYGAVPIETLRAHLDQACIDKAIRAYMKGRKLDDCSLAGVSFEEERKTRVRA